jgi:hypothetical protein
MPATNPEARWTRRDRNRKQRRRDAQIDKQRPRYVEAVGPDEAGICCDGSASWLRLKDRPQEDTQ